MTTFLKENKWPLAVLILVGSFLYLFNLNGPLFYDDINWIVNNPSVQALTWANLQFIFTHDSLAGVHQISNYYRPFMFVTFVFNYLTSGTNPFSYHLVNNLIHVTNGILIYYLVLRWLGKKRVAFLVALLFLIHPLQTEAVAYVSGRGDPMSIMFILLGILLYLNRRPWLAGGAMVLAILSRETGVLFPAYLGIVLVAFELKGLFWERIKSAFLKVLPYAGISLVYGALRLTVLNFQNTLNFYTQQNIYTEHITYRIFTFFHALEIYLRLILWPTGLHMDRNILINVNLYDHWAWVGALFILMSVGWLLWLYRTKNWPLFYLWFFGLGIFFVNLSMTSGIIAPINGLIYEHWLYFSLFGFFTIAAWYMDRVWVYIGKHGRALKLFLVFCTLTYCLFLSVQTIRRNLLWANDIGMYENIIYYEPNDSHVLYNLANWYSEHRDQTNAVRLFKQAIAVNPDDPTAYVGMGINAYANGLNDEAEGLFLEAIQINPALDSAYYNLAPLYLNEGRDAQALNLLRKLEAIHPTPATESFIQDIENIPATEGRPTAE